MNGREEVNPQEAQQRSQTGDERGMDGMAVVALASSDVVRRTDGLCETRVARARSDGAGISFCTEKRCRGGPAYF